MARKVFFFAYGINMLKERLHMFMPSAVFVKTAELRISLILPSLVSFQYLDYELSFCTYARDPKKTTWKGAHASINKKSNACVWGSVWWLSETRELDGVEGFHTDTYLPLVVDVLPSRGHPLRCRTHQVKTSNAECYCLPSPQYMEIMLLGAEQNGLPGEYISHLKAIKHNNNSETVDEYRTILKLIKKR